MRRPALLVVCLAVFVDMVGFGIILPVLPFQAGALGGSGVWVGGLLTAYAAAQFAAAPVLGALSDRYGRRPLLLWSLVGSMISLALTGLAGSLALLLGARLLAGGFGGAIAVGQAYAVDLAGERERTRALGLVGASIGLGFVIGPGIGGGLSGAGLGFGGICLVASGLAAVNLALGIAVLPRVPTAGERTVQRRTPTQRRTRTAPGRPGSGGLLSAAAGRLGALVAALATPSMRPVLLAVFAQTFAFAGMETTFALLGARRYGLGPGGLGVVFVGVGLVMVAVQGGLVGRLAAQHGDRAVAVLGAGLLAIGLLVLPFTPPWIGYPALGLVAAGQGLLTTTTAALIAAASGRRVGGALGISQSAAAGARASGPIVAGLLFDVGAALPYLLGGVLCLVAAALLTLPAGQPADAERAPARLP